MITFLLDTSWKNIITSMLLCLLGITHQRHIMLVCPINGNVNLDHIIYARVLYCKVTNFLFSINILKGNTLRLCFSSQFHSPNLASIGDSCPKLLLLYYLSNHDSIIPYTFSNWNSPHSFKIYLFTS